jgi:hypothetical protein
VTTSEQSFRDWLITTIAAIEEMSESRHLVRSRSGTMIHRDICRHARKGVPWVWADDASADEIRAAAGQFGYHYCIHCKPEGTL